MFLFVSFDNLIMFDLKRGELFLKFLVLFSKSECFGFDLFFLLILVLVIFTNDLKVFLILFDHGLGL